MLNKTILVAALSALPFGASTFAGSPLISLTEDGSAAIFFVADASATYSDNIYYQKNKTDDVIFTVAPGFELVAGGDGNTKFSVVFKEAFNAYLDNDQLNTQLANVDAKLTYDTGSPLKATLTGGFHQTAQPNNQVAGIIQNDIVTTDTFYAGLNAELQATEKSTLVTGARYNGVRYTNYGDLFNDTDSFSIPVSWYYSVTEKLQAGFTYQYTYTDIAGSAFSPSGDQQIHFGGLTARGEVTDKLKLEANAGIGYSELSRDNGFGGQDDTTFNFSLTSTYAATEKVTLSLTGAREFSVGALGQQLTTTRGVFGVNYAFAEDWSANANTGYAVQEFNPGKDNIFSAGAGLAYTPNKYWKISANYSYMYDDSTRVANFDNHMFSLSASLKY